MNAALVILVIHACSPPAMRSTITSRGQTVIPAAIRERFSLTPAQRLEWIVEADGSIRVVPVDPSPVKAFRGMGRVGSSTQRLLADREAERAICG
jgi:AbrB family looped-hinge helix DNA binding protein